MILPAGVIDTVILTMKEDINEIYKNIYQPFINEYLRYGYIVGKYPLIDDLVQLLLTINSSWRVAYDRLEARHLEHELMFRNSQ
jgi:hypothetical protein